MEIKVKIHGNYNITDIVMEIIMLWKLLKVGLTVG